MERFAWVFQLFVNLHLEQLSSEVMAACHGTGFLLCKKQSQGCDHTFVGSVGLDLCSIYGVLFASVTSCQNQQ